MTQLTSRKKYHSSLGHHDDEESSMVMEEQQGGAPDRNDRVSQFNEGGEHEEIDDSKNNDINNFDEDEDEDEDVNLSIRSNITFVLGGLLQLALSSWDYLINKENISLNQRQYYLYNLLGIAGPLVYFSNSVIDVHRVLTVRGRKRNKVVGKSHHQNNDQKYCRTSDDGCEWSGFIQKITTTTTTSTSGNKIRRRGGIGLRLRLLLRKIRHWQHHVVTTIVAASTSIFQRSTIHTFGHRRELGAAATFGIAALLSVISVLCRLYTESSSSSSMLLMKPSFNDDDKFDEGQELSTLLEGASVHIYLVSAILALWRWPSPLLFMQPSSSWLRWCCFGNCSRDTICVNHNKNKPATTTNISSSNSYNDDDSIKKGNTTTWYSDVGSLETLGDALFGLSSVVDVCLQDANVNEIHWWQVASSLLWTVDALLYLRGDFVSLYGVEQQHRRPS